MDSQTRNRAAAATAVRPGDELTVEVTDLNDDGDGVGRASDGLVLFVPGALPGERVRVRVSRVSRRHAVAEPVERLIDAPCRVVPPCPVAGACGGCRLQHASYQAQLAWKTQRVRTALRLAGLEGVPVAEILGMASPFHYRNKAQYPVRRGPKGEVLLGFFRRESHEIVPHDECLIQHPLIPRVAEACRRAAEELEIEPYDERQHRGVLRHLVVRVSFARNEAMVVLVTRTRTLPAAGEFIERIRRSVPAVVSVAQNVNEERTNVIFGRTTRILWGRAALIERLGRLEFEISPTSFFQVNPAGAKCLYDMVTEFVGPAARTLWDIYCGAGTIGLYVAAALCRPVRLLGVDSSHEAIADARRNAARNKIESARFVVGRAEHVVPRWVAAGEESGVWLLDPPRSGCAQEVLAALAAVRPERVVYVSCNPVTFARDLSLMQQVGYRTRRVQPVDMFPQTPHIEAVAWVERQ